MRESILQCHGLCMGSNRERHREIELSRAWAGREVPGDLRLVDGRRLQVIYSGVWSNSDGPDFKNAMVAIDGRMERGAVEIHIRSSDWYRHGHDADPAYDGVVLHVVQQDDHPESVRTSSGRRLPTLVMGNAGTLHHTERETEILATLGQRTCLPTLGREQPERVRSVLRDRGWSRLVSKQLRFSQELQVLTGPEVLYRGLLESLGYSANRESMVGVGERVPLQLLQRFASMHGEVAAMAALLGVAGFLPLTPSNAALIGERFSPQSIEKTWTQLRTGYGFEPLSGSAWTLNRVRPANHPIVRLASLASLVAGLDAVPLFERFLNMPLDGGRSWDRWLSTARPAIGAPRRRQIIVNILAPMIAAYADLIRDEELAERVAEDWERLPGAVNDSIARSTRRQIVGDLRFPIRYALEEQGLHEIYRDGCSELRCFECPIARLAVEYEPLPGTTD